MKRKPKVDPRGHKERPGYPVPACVGCWHCEHARLKNRDWIEPCPAASEAKQKATASAG